MLGVILKLIIPTSAGTTVGKLEYKFNDKYQDGTDKGINSQDRGSMDIDTSFQCT